MSYKKYVMIGCWIAGTLGAGCSKETSVLGTMPNGAIQFVTPISKAAVTNESPMTNFGVWGFYSKDNKEADVFNGEQKVTESGSQWTYSPKQYWIAGATYNFYAVYPYNLAKATVTSTGITIKDFDASAKTGEEAIDLMTASATDISYTENQTPAPVPLSFEHLLARVEFIGKIDAQSAAISNMRATITEAKLYGMNEKGSYTSATQQWTLNIQTTAEAPFATCQETPLSTDETSLFGDLLLFPEKVDGNFTFQVNYTVNDTPKKQTIQLNGLVGMFEAGKYYRFTFTVIDEEHILFDRPTVSTWDEATGGIIVVD